MGTFSDGSQQDLTASVSWSSASTAVATVSPAGLGTSVSGGTSLVTATLGGINGTTLLTVTPAAVVSIVVSPGNEGIPLGFDQAFTAQGTFTDASTQDVTNSAHWSSLAPGVATISDSPGTNGVATGVGAGNTAIMATLGSASGTANLTVTTAIMAAIQVNPVSPSIVSGGNKEQFTATGIYTDGSSADITSSVTWSSSNATVATISNAAGSNGLATSAVSGATRI